MIHVYKIRKIVIFANNVMFKNITSYKWQFSIEIWSTYQWSDFCSTLQKLTLQFLKKTYMYKNSNNH